MPHIDDHLVQDWESGRTAVTSRKWSEYDQWRNLAEWTVELPCDDLPPRALDWWTKDIYVSWGTDVYLNNCVRAYSTLARVLSLIPDTMNTPADLVTIDIPEASNRSIFLWVERGELPDTVSTGNVWSGLISGAIAGTQSYLQEKALGLKKPDIVTHLERSGRKVDRVYEEIEQAKREKEGQAASEAEAVDPALWATTGGAPAVTINGQKIRSKWAWALAELAEGRDSYDLSRRDLVREELDDLDHTHVELFGSRRRWQGGVLSGWRLTSLFGTLASHLLCEYITRDRPYVKWIVLGDDIMLYSHVHNAMPDLYERIDEFGLNYSKEETLVGPQGTCLRRHYGCGPLRFMAGPALRQLFYANPWIDRGQFTGPREIANSWLQYISRMAVPIPRQWLLRQAAADMARWAQHPDWDSRVWKKLLQTDSGLGGLGTIDTARGHNIYALTFAGQEECNALSDPEDFTTFRRYRRAYHAALGISMPSDDHSDVEDSPTSRQYAFGDVYDVALRTVDSSEVSGAMVNLVTAAGRIDNAAIFNLIKMRSAVTGVSFEEAAPAGLCLMRMSWPGGVDLLTDPRLLQQFPDMKVLSWKRFLPDKKPSKYSRPKIEMALTTLDEFIAIKTQDRPVTGWSGVSNATFNALVSVIPIAANELTDSAFWLYVMSFLDTRVWQGLSKYITIGRLNMGLIDQKTAKEKAYTADYPFDAVIGPYSDFFHIPGPRKVLLVVIDATSKSSADRLYIGPPGNSAYTGVHKQGGAIIPIDIAPNLLTALTGSNWNDWPSADSLSDPGEDVWYQAQKMLEHYVAVEDVIDIAVGVVTATAHRVLAQSIDETKETGDRTHQGSWLLNVKRFSGPNEDYNLTWYGYQNADTCKSRLCNQETRYWTPMGITGYHYMTTWTDSEMWMTDEQACSAPPAARLSEASDIARLWRALGIYEGPNHALELRTRRAFEMFFSANATMLASMVSVGQMALGVPMSTWSNYSSIDKRWYAWFRAFIEISIVNAIG
ncbi:hypothetical protein COOONC_01343 [Cooperia oncophora]